jgi:hypothetical protein
MRATQFMVGVMWAFALVSNAYANASIGITDDRGSSIAKVPHEMRIAQAWWDAAYDAANAHQQPATQQASGPAHGPSRRHHAAFR